LPEIFIARPATLLNKWELLQAIILDLAKYRTKRSQTGSTIAVAARLLDHYNSQTGLCCPSLETLAKAVGISKRQVGRCIDVLVEWKWITKQQRYDKSTLYAFNWRRLSGGNVRDQDDHATDVRDSGTDVHESATDVRDRATDVHLNLESNPGTKTGNLTLPGGESEQPPLDSKTGDQHPITDIAQADPPIAASDFHIAQADPSDIGNSITPATDIEQAFADFWRHYPATNHSEPAHIVRAAFLAALKAGADTSAIITGAIRYAAVRAHQDPQYTMAMSNWLKRRHWETDKLPGASTTTSTVPITSIDQHGNPIPAPAPSRPPTAFEQSVRTGIAKGLTQTSLFIQPLSNGKDHNG
jgi:hypothetical protein